ncbi:hypothetical protein [Lentzea sp. NPDC051838]|uniref:hypothetical protein n=1 Tax=Lentzea sp. NPDC051838 TaxID=3154849 RepID=UPI00343A0168
MAEINAAKPLDRRSHRNIGDVDITSHVGSGPSVDLITRRQRHKACQSWAGTPGKAKPPGR